MKWAVTEKFKDYLMGATVTVFTDNIPLAHLQSAKLGATEQRWVAQLASYNYTVKYRAGQENTNADALSRRPAVEVMTNAVLEEETQGGDETPAVDWARWQQDDPEVRQLCYWVSRQQWPSVEDRRNAPPGVKKLLTHWKRLKVREGVLYRKVNNPFTCELLEQVVPRAKGEPFGEATMKQ